MMIIIRETNDTTIMSGPVANQGALRGLLIKVRDPGLALIAVGRGGPVQEYVADAAKIPEQKAIKPAT